MISVEVQSVLILLGITGPSAGSHYVAIGNTIVHLSIKIDWHEGLVPSGSKQGRQFVDFRNCCSLGDYLPILQGI